jgi:putative peptide zinc metalloprotease protein
MLAGSAPRLRRNLRFMRHERDEQISWVVKDSTALKYYRFGQIEAWLMQQMDGNRSVPQICENLYNEVGMRASPAAVEKLVRRLKELGLVERTHQERSALLMDRLRTQRSTWKNGQNTLLRMRWSFGDPDVLLGRMVKAMPFFWTPAFVIASIIGFGVYGVLLFQHWQPFAESIVTLYSPSRMTLELFVISYACFSVTAVIHEFGHGLTCKRFGGEVHEIGGMVLYFAPAFYCNVSDAWTFEKRSHRMWVTFAGGWIQLWCAVVATVLWRVTEPGTFINTAALFTAALSGAFSLLFNYNPLIPLDGYYALIDWLEIPNLRSRAFCYLGASFRRHVLRLSVPLPTVTERERRIFLTYAILSGIYTLVVLALFAGFVAKLLIPRFGAWGLATFLLLLFLLTAKPRAAITRVLRTVVVEKVRPKRYRFAAFALGLLLLAGLAATFLPWTLRATATATVEPEARRWLRPVESARLTEVRFPEGAMIRAGDTIAVLREPQLELDRITTLNAQKQLDARAARARASGNALSERAAAIELETVRQQLAAIERRRAGLVLQSPFDGMLVTPRLEERLGEQISAGDSVLEVWSLGSLRARVRVPQRLGGDIAQGAELRIRFAARPGLTWRTRIDRVESAAQGSDLIALVQLPTAEGQPLLPGMQGRARIDIAHATVARALERAARRIIRLELFL